MSIKLVFQDNDGKRLQDKDILCGKSAHLPKKGDVVQFANGQQATVESRLFVYSDGQRGKSDVRIKFICKKQTKLIGGVKMTPENKAEDAPLKQGERIDLVESTKLSQTVRAEQSEGGE